MANFKTTVEENFTRYAGNVILDRAICDVRDMLKPTARMLMYSQMHITKNTPDKPFVKSARVVGDAMGHYYTHGDSSCYGTYMRMAKPFAMRYPLEECQGNSGTITSTGDEAASRYTELRLSKLGGYLFKDIDKETIDRWSDNFDETDKYPSSLPSKGFYNIVNGTTGIGVAISSSIPQFNLKEINNAMCKLLWNPNAPDSQIIVMPDFATGGIILNAPQVKESLIKGNGAACLIRSVIEYDAKNRCFKVKEIPYGVYTNTITNQIQQLLEEQPECGIEGINDGSGKTPDYIIYISKNANPEKVLNLLYKETSLQSFFTINMTVLKDGKTPKVMGLREMLLEHLKYEETIYRRGYEFDEKKIEKRIHIIDGLLICMANIDEVVHTIKNSSSTQDAATSLKAQFLLDDEQVKAVLDMKLSRLAHLEVQKLENEKLSFNKELEQIIAILNDENLLKQEVEKGLREVAVKFGDERRTKIENSIELNDEEINVKKQKIAVILNNNQEIRAINLEEFKSTGKGTKGTLIDKDIKDIICTETYSTIAAIDKEGTIYFINTNLIPIQEEGVKIDSICDCGEIVKIARFENKKYIILTTKQGYVKKSLMTEYNLSKKQQGIKLKDNDEVISILFADEDENILIVNENGKLNNYPVSDIRINGRVTYGTKGSQFLIKSIAIAKKNNIVITYSLDGKGKKTSFNELPVNSKNSTGAVITEDTIGIANVSGDKILICGDTGRIIVVNSDDIALHSIKSAGSKLINGVILKIDAI